MLQMIGKISEHRVIHFGLVLILLLSTFQGVSAQTGQPSGPVYVVQAGDTLWSIALRFNVSMADLQSTNNLSNPDQLSTGMRLVIPGLEGVEGELTTVAIAFGENLRSLSRQYNVDEQVLLRLNHLTSNFELVVGAELVIPVSEAGSQSLSRLLLAPGESLLEMAVLSGANPWDVMAENAISGSWQAVPGDLFYLAGGQQGPGALPGAISSLEMRPDQLEQGRVMTLELRGQPGMQIQGALAGRNFVFQSDEPGHYVALQGVHALAAVGVYPLVLDGTLPDGSVFHFQQSIVIGDGGYPYDPVLVVRPETIDPAVTMPEDAEWTALAQPVNPQRLWQGAFSSPVPAVFSECFPSGFGNRRSYNGSEYRYFHTGLDFCGQTGTEIYAPAAGKVVFAGPLTVRGNATMIDHGWGIYTGYMHQSEIYVQPGDIVQPGQLIGLVGSTGRVTGPHLHFEVWAGGVQVDPLEWLERSFP